jgi:hypothetical protein
VLPPSHRDLLEVLADAAATAGREHRAAAGLSTDTSKIEGLRSKLKPLAERGWLAEDEPGLSTLPHREAQDGSPPHDLRALLPRFEGANRIRTRKKRKKSPMKPTARPLATVFGPVTVRERQFASWITCSIQQTCRFSPTEVGLGVPQVAHA